ncbi:MAG: class I SAM-dependent methyltransferase [Chloroflexi bacterium]|nr:class I SAM-dependent methyltransferase [Chloroflexota bacterium]
MSEDVHACPLCGSNQSSLFDRRAFRGLEVVNCLCRACELVYMSPRMSEAEAAEFYQAEYRQLYQGDENPIAKDFATQTARADSLLSFVKLHAPAVTRHLDIGCSTGLILQGFQKYYCCQAVGIEPGDAYRTYARKQGLTVYATLDELKTWPELPFDLITMSHVLEHLPDPAAYLAHLREKVLASDGWLVLEVPNLYCHDSFEVAHLVSYSAHTLSQIVIKAGFGIVAVEKHGRPRSDLLPLYITLLARPAEQTWSLHPERFVALKRRVGLLRRRILERLFPQKAWKNYSESPER